MNEYVCHQCHQGYSAEKPGCPDCDKQCNATGIPGLSSAEIERLAVLAEECGEVIHIVGKILRHGYESCNPVLSSGETNREYLHKELGDLINAINMMQKCDIDLSTINELAKHKAGKIKPYLHHQC
jgi:NTP pyrophosphatase (non-canonical NTP hydrolase)